MNYSLFSHCRILISTQYCGILISHLITFILCDISPYIIKYRNDILLSIFSQKYKNIPQNHKISVKQYLRNHLLHDRLLHPKLKIWVNICQMWAWKQHSYLTLLSAFSTGDNLWCKKRERIQTKLWLRLDMSLRGYICLPMLKSKISSVDVSRTSRRKGSPFICHISSSLELLSKRDSGKTLACTPRISHLCTQRDSAFRQP